MEVLGETHDYLIVEIPYIITQNRTISPYHNYKNMLYLIDTDQYFTTLDVNIGTTTVKFNIVKRYEIDNLSYIKGEMYLFRFHNNGSRVPFVYMKV